MFDERDDSLRRARGVQHIGAVNFAGIGHSIEILQGAVRFRFREAHLNASRSAGVGLELARCAQGDDFAVIHDGHAVAEALGFLYVVSGHENGLFLAAEFLDDVVNLAANLRIETSGGLVEEKHFGIIDQSHGEGEPLLLAARKLAVKRVALFFEAEALEQFLRLAAALVEAGEETQGFHDAQLVGKGSRLQRGADLVFESLRFALRVEAADGDAAAGIAETFKNLDGRGFAGAVRPEQTENFSFFHVEADAANGFDVAVALDEVFHLKNGIGHVFCPSPFGGGAAKEGIAYRKMSSWLET